jgi:hypothetical protein
MILSSNENNINIAYLNQKKYNNLLKEDKKKWIYNIYNFYNKSIPIISYSKKDIDYSFKILCDKQNYSVKADCNNYSEFEKYKFNYLIKFIKNNNNNNNTTNNIKNNRFLNCNLLIIDTDYKKYYVDICALSDFYQNKERVKCKVLKYNTPCDYYKKNYYFILDKYFSNLGTRYEKGLFINELSFENNIEEFKKSINPIYIQNIIYDNNKFCTVYKPYLFKLFINIFRGDKKPIILDLSSGWGDRLLGTLSIQDDIEKYIGIDPNNNLFEGYNKMINDLCHENNKKKFELIQKPAEEVDYVLLDNDIDIIFWSPPFFDQELYINDNNRDDFKKQSVETFKNYEEWEDNFLISVINKATNNLKINGVLILYLGHINYESVFKKINNINKIQYIGDIIIKGDKAKNYFIFVKIIENYKCTLLTKKNGNISKINKIKKKLKTMEDNPPLHIIELKLPNNNKINLIQESVLIAGTKQRVACEFIKAMTNENIKKITYTGTYNGYGAIATAYAAYKLGFQSEVFLSEIPTGNLNKSTFDNIINSKQINTLLALNSKIYLCPDYKTARNLKYDYSTLITKTKDVWENKKDYYNVPLGLSDDERIMIFLLSSQILKAAANTILEKSSNLRFWLVAGTSGIAQAIYMAYPYSKLFLYLTGGGKHIKRVMAWINNNSNNRNNITIINNNKIKYNVDDVINDYSKYYKSVKNYDSHVWPYIKKYGENGDFLWNVASD